ncbi:MAG: hypothetical protein ACXU8R_07560, partial [Xanthobacteraceae bacterium]
MRALRLVAGACGLRIDRPANNRMVSSRDRVGSADHRTRTMNVTKVGIVGLGRWAKVLTRAASKSQT